MKKHHRHVMLSGSEASSRSIGRMVAPDASLPLILRFTQDDMSGKR
jgi:hypothetical protein